MTISTEEIRKTITERGLDCVSDVEGLKLLARLEQAEKERDALRALVVMRFDLGCPPQFTQGHDLHELTEPVTAEHCRWFVAEIERLRTDCDDLRAEVIHIKEVEFPRKAQAVADGWRGKCERLEAKVAEMEIGKREISEAHNVAKRRLSALAGENIALRAKVVEMGRQEPVAWYSKQYGFVYMSRHSSQFKHGSILYLRNGTPAWRIEGGSKVALLDMASLPHGTVFYALPGAKGE